jgi:hypothetical protein
MLGNKKRRKRKYGRNKYVKKKANKGITVKTNWENSLMFVLCIIRRGRNYQHYALNFTTPVFYILAPTCFDSSLPSSGSFLDLSELLEILIEWVVYHIMCDYVTCVPECRGLLRSE